MPSIQLEDNSSSYQEKSDFYKKPTMSSNNLLAFVTNASSNIQEAMINTNHKRRRNVTVKKFAENRVKRLENSKKPRTGNLTKSKLAQLKPVETARSTPSSTTIASLLHSSTWPLITPPTCTTSSSFFARSESQLPTSEPSRPIDPELESLLSELECPSVPLSRHGSFESVHTGSSCTPPLNTLEAQVYVAEQAFSPYSDYSAGSDELDYSPPGSTQMSYSCSPVNLTSTMPDWSAGDLLPPVPMREEVGMRCGWVSPDAPLLTIDTPSSLTSVYDQGPPMTPTVSQLLEQYNQY